MGHKNLLSHIKTCKQILTFGDIEIEKIEFYRQKTPTFLKDVKDFLKDDIEKVLMSNKISSGEESYKYFVGYLYKDHKVK